MELDLRGLLRIMRRRWWLLIAIPLLAGAEAYLFTAQQTPTYEATVTVRVYPSAANADALSLNSVEGTQTLVETFRRLVTARPVLSTVIEELHLSYSAEDLERRVSSSTIPNTQLFTLSVQDSNPGRAARIANALAGRLPDVVAEPGLKTSVAQPASAPSTPIAPRPLVTTLLAIVAGVLLAITVVALLEYLDDAVRESSDLAVVAGVPLLASIARIPPMLHRHRRPLVVETMPRSRSAEAVGMLRANVEVAIRKNGIRTIMICSPGENEGRSTVAANLAVALSHAGLQTVLVDADFRHPILHTLFRTNNQDGLASLLSDPSIDWSSVAQHTHVPNLALVTSGAGCRLPTTMLSLDRLRERMIEMSLVADAVIVDTPPFLGLSDAFVVASSVDSVITVCAVGKTRVRAFRSTASTLSHSDVRLLGTILNRPLPAWHLRRLGRFFTKQDGGPTADAPHASTAMSPSETATSSTPRLMSTR